MIRLETKQLGTRLVLETNDTDVADKFIKYSKSLTHNAFVNWMAEMNQNSACKILIDSTDRDNKGIFGPS